MNIDMVNKLKTHTQQDICVIQTAVDADYVSLTAIKNAGVLMAIYPVRGSKFELLSE